MSSLNAFHASLKAKGRGAKGWANSWTEVEHLGNGKFAASISTGHRVFKDKTDGKWKKCKLIDERPNKDYVLIQSAKCCVEVYPFYAKYFDVHHEEVRLYEERWVVQRLFKEPDTWRDVDAYNPVMAVEEFPDALKVTIVYDTDYGPFTIEYFQRDGSALKHNVFFTNNSNQTEIFRVVQKWAGIVGTKCNGKDVPVEEDKAYFAFHSVDKPQREFNIAENLGSMVFNPDGSEKTERCLQRPIKVESHAQGLKTDFIYAQWDLAQDESLTIDPATATLNDPTEDGHIYLRISRESYARYNSYDTFICGGGANEHDYRGYVEWSVSSIPDGSTITDTVFKYHGYSKGNTDAHIHEMMGTRPSTGSDADVHTEAGEGIVYANPTGFIQLGINKEQDLGANADSHLQYQLTHGDWFAIGLQQDDIGSPTGQYNTIYAKEYASTPDPTLYVVYTPPIDPPTVTTQAADNIGVGAGTLNGTITDIGGENADERGFDYDYDSGTPYAYEETDLGDFGTGAFEEALSGLSEGVTVYFRAKAHNSGGWGYGSELNFRTLKAVAKSAAAGFGTTGVSNRSFTGMRTLGATVNMVGLTGRLKYGFRDVSASISQIAATVRQVAFTRSSGFFKFPYTFPFRFGAVSGIGATGIAAGIWTVTRIASAVVGLVGVAERGWIGIRDAYASITRVPPVLSDTILALNMNEGTGNTVYDSSGEGNHGTIYGAEWVDGPYGKALEFDGVNNDYIDIPDTAKLPLFTLEALVYNVAGGDARHSLLRNFWEIVGTQLCFWSYDFADDYWRNSPVGTVPYDTWTRIFTTWDGSVIRHYANGELVWTDPNPSSGTSQNFVTIGGYSGRIFKGKVAELNIYDRTLGSAEIKLRDSFGAQRSFVGERSAAPSISVATTAARAQVLLRVASAAVSNVGASIRNWVGSRNVTASVAQTATAARTIVVTRAASGIAAIVGTVGRMYGALRTIAAAMDMAGTSARIKLAFRSVAATIGLVGTKVRIKHGFRYATASMSQTAANIRAIAVTRFSGFLKFPYTFPFKFGSVAGIGAVGTATASWVIVRVASAAASMSGIAARGWTGVRDASAVVGIVGATIRGWVGTRAASAVASIVGTPARIIGALRSAAAVVNIAGITIREWIGTRAAFAVMSVAPPISSSAVLALRLDEGRGNIAYDASGEGNDGTITGADWVSGKFGKALSFDATDNVNCGNDPSLQIDGDITIIFWVYPFNLGAKRENPIDKSYGGEFAFTLEDDPEAGKINYYHGTARATGKYWGWAAINTGTVKNDEWQMIAVTRSLSETRMRSYYNGEPHKTALYSTEPDRLPSKSGYSVLVGRGYASTAYAIVDDVHIIPGTYTDDDIKNHFNLGAQRHFVGGRGTSAGFSLSGVSLRIKLALRSAAAVLGITGTAVRSWIGTRAASVAVSMVAASTRMYGSLRTAAATVSVTGATVRGWIGTRISGLLKFPYTFPFRFGSRSAIDVAGITTRSLVGTRVGSAVMSVNATITRMKLALRMAVASVEMIGTATRSFIGARFASATASIVGIPTGIKGAIRLAAAAVSTTGIAIREWVGTRSAIASAAILSISIREWIGTRIASGAVSVVGTSGRIKSALRSSSVALGISGTALRNWIGTRAVSATTSMVAVSARMYGSLRLAAASVGQTAATVRAIVVTRFSGLLKFPYTFPFKFGSASGIGIVGTATRSLVGIIRVALAGMTVTGTAIRLKHGLRMVPVAVSMIGATTRSWIGSRITSASLGLTAIVSTAENVFYRSVSAAVSVAGVAVRSLVGTRDASAAIGIVGTTVRGWIGARFASATASIVGISVRMYGALRSIAATVGITGVTIRIKHGLRTAMASMSQTATAIRAIAVTRFSGLLKFPYAFPFKFGSVSGIGVVATATRSWMNTRIVSAAMSVAGTVARVWVGTRALAGSISVIGVSIRSWIGSRVTSASVGLSAVGNGIKAAVRFASAAVNITGAVSRSLVLIRTLSAAITAQGVTGRMYSALRSVAAAVGIVGSADRIKHGLRVAVAAMEITGATARSWVGDRIASVTVSIIGAPMRIKAAFRSVLAAVGIVGTTARQWVGTRISGLYKFPYSFPFKFGSKSAIGIVATATPSWILIRIASAAVSVVGAAVRIIDTARAVSAATVITGISDRAITVIRTASESIGLAAVSVRSWIGTRVNSAAASISATAARMKLAFRGAVASVGIAGTVGREWVGTRIASAAASMIGTAVRIKFGVRTAIASMGIVGTAGRSWIGERITSAAVSVVGIPMRVKYGFRSVAATISIIEVAGRRWVGTRFSGLLKFPYTFPFKFGSKSGIGVVATATRSWIGVRIASAVASITGVTARSLVLTRAASASVAITGIASRIYGALRLATAAFSITGTTGRIKYAFRAAIAAMGMVGTAAGSWAITRFASAAVSVTGVATRTIDITRAAVGSASLTAVVVRGWIGARTASAAIGLAGVATRVKSAFRSAVGSIGVEAVTARVKGGFRTVSAAVGIIAVAGRRWVGTRFSGVFKFPYTFPFKFGSVSAIIAEGTAARSWIGTRVSSAAVSVSAAATWVRSAFREAAASIGVAGTATRSFVGTRFASAAVSAVGIASRIKSIVKAAAAAVDIIGTTDREWIGTRASVASISAVGVAVRSWVGTRLASASAGLSAIGKAARGYFRSAAAAVNMAGIAVRNLAGTRAVSAAFSMVGTTVRGWVGTRVISAAMSNIGIAGRMIVTIRTAASGVSVAGVTDRALTLAREAVASAGIVAVSVRSWIGERATEAAATIVGVPSRLKHGLRSASATLSQTAVSVRVKALVRVAAAIVSVVGITGRVIEVSRSVMATVTTTAMTVRSLVLERSRSAVIGVATVGRRIYYALRTVVASISVVADVWIFRFILKRIATLQLVGKTTLLNIAGKAHSLNIAGKTHLLNIIGKIHLLNIISKTRLLSIARKEKTLLLSTKVWILDLADKIRKMRFGR